jgi:hypothetical protein
MKKRKTHDKTVSTERQTGRWGHISTLILRVRLQQGTQLLPGAKHSRAAHHDVVSRYKGSRYRKPFSFSARCYPLLNNPSPMLPINVTPLREKVLSTLLFFAKAGLLAGKHIYFISCAGCVG